MAQDNVHYFDKSTEYTANFDYIEPCLVMTIHDRNERYVIHKFRKGSPKSIIEHALANPQGIAKKSEFRSGSGNGKAISGAFSELLKQLVDVEKFPHGKMRFFIKELTPSKVAVGRETFVISRKEYKQIAEMHKKFE